MRRITVITGPAESGKTFLSKNMALNYENPVFIDGRSTEKKPFRFSQIDNSVDLIIVDDVNNLSFFKKLLKLVAAKVIFIDTPGIEGYYRLTPNIIINTTLEPTELPFLDICNVISCWRNANGIFVFEKGQDNDPEDIIKHKGLTEREVWLIVKEWYTNGMYPDILQDEDGRDLEEIAEHKLYL